MTGFKSFASKSVLEFRKGIMAVVGPNGCGKSNIVDAIRWVLGEQRTSILRAERMEAVVFNGTERRRPLGMAEVTLTIDNDQGRLPSLYSEVAITRRLYRSGESEYQINRNPSRLRDIQDLFTGTGFSTNAYSIIELSMVEGIISGSSTIRRALFEEASGISAYKNRRNAAEKKLLNTREKLTRVNDRFGEVEKRYHILKRQASRVNRYKVLTRAIQLRQLIDLAYHRLKAIDRLKPLEVRLKNLSAELESTEEKISQLGSQLIALQGQMMTVEYRLTHSQNNLKRLDRRETENDRELALIKQRIEFLGNEQLEADKRNVELEASVSHALESIQASQAELEKTRLTTRENDEKKAELEAQTRKLAVEITDCRRNLTKFHRSEADAQKKLTRSQEQYRHLKGNRELLAKKIEQLSLQKSRTIESINITISELEELRKKEVEAVGEFKLAEKCLTDASTRLDKVRAVHKKTLARHARISAEVGAASTVLKAHLARSRLPETIPDEVREIIAEKDLFTIADRIKCKPEHQAAVSSSLQTILEALDCTDMKSVLQLADRMGEDRWATFRLPRETPDSPPGFTMPDAAQDCIAGPDIILNNDPLGDFLRKRLSKTLVVPQLSDLARLADWAAENGITLVVLTGEILEPDGILRIGVFNSEAFRIGWISERENLEHTLNKLQKEQSEAAKEMTSAAREMQEADTELNRARQTHRRCEDNIAALKRDVKGYESDVIKLRGQEESLSGEIETAKSELNSLPQEKAPDEEIEKLQSAFVSTRRSRQECEKKLQSLEQERLKVTEQRAAVATERTRLGELITSVSKRIDRHLAELLTAQNNLASHNARMTENTTDLDRARGAEKNIAAHLQLLHKEQKNITDAVDTGNRELSELKAQREKCLVNQGEARKNQADLLKEQNRLETELTALTERLKDIDRRLLEEAHIQPEQVNDDTPRKAELELTELKLSEVSSEKLRIRLQSLGAVNMLAIEELHEEEEQYNFLKEQKTDLEKGIDLVEETITRIDTDARHRFIDTFTMVNEYFQDIFRTLFEGGEAAITLEDGDPLQADIRIMATPSGKKLQPLSMLSGGEKALTAIAMLFAIYRVSPSPFCILDEVDAPLDDANILRFTRLLTRFAKDTQFLLVTHNKRTMETADSMFGVTLGKDGASTLVSVKIETLDSSSTSVEHENAISG